MEGLGSNSKAEAPNSKDSSPPPLLLRVKTLLSSIESSSSSSKSETPNSRDSPTSPLSLETPLGSFTKLQLRSMGSVDSNQEDTTASIGDDFVVWPSNTSSFVDTQQFEAVNDSQDWRFFDKYFSGSQTRAVQPESSRPLNPQAIWPNNNFSNGGYFMGSTPYSGPGSSIGSLNYGNRPIFDYEQSNFVRNLTRDSMSINSGYLTPSMSNLAAQFEGNPFSGIPGSVSQGRKEPVSMNSGSLAPSMSNLAAQFEDPFMDNPNITSKNGLYVA